MIKTALLYMSEQPKLQHLAMRMELSRRTARRFVAGETIQEAVEAISRLNDQGFSATIDYLGENVSSENDALRATNEYLQALDEIQKKSADSNVSLKLTQFGLSIHEEMTSANVERVVLRARDYNNFVRIDMEGSPYTDSTLRIFRSLRQKYENVGIVVQAYLYRTEKDIEDLLQLKSRIRLCKGAYKEPPTIAFKKKIDTDRNYIQLMKILLKSGIYHGIATHDPAMIQATKKFAKTERIANEQFEFQMLYGIRRDLQSQLIHEGYKLRVYVPYGEEWYSYLMRRMAERPANLFFVVRNLFRG
ncbi:MAG TPA: proline dehydrogenase family protein [Acidobacteriota bacterium]|nr:proline dehydrogenase family protein [Acidobacteriota bacterium]